MDYVKTIKATPNTLMALLLAKAIKKENVNSLPDNMAGYISKSGREAGGEAPYFSKIQVDLK